MSEQTSFLRMPAVLRQTGLKESTMYRLIEARTFPKPLSISERCVGWIASEIDDWCRARVEAHQSKRRSRPRTEPCPKKRIRVDASSDRRVRA
jgi:prophage regulatory protein